MRGAVDHQHLDSTSQRNRRVERLYSYGLSHKEIAYNMRLNEKTVSAICAVLGLRRKR